MSIRVFYRVGLIAAGVILVASLGGLNAQQSTAEAVSIGNDDIGGVVSSAKGPEAGVLVIAETSDLPTKFVKIVVTDDGGRYVLPQLPKYRCSRIGPTGLRQANCRRDRKEWSGTWSSPSGTGPIPRHICTMRSLPTSGIRRSTPTV